MGSELSDEELIRRYIDEGDVEAYQELFLRYDVHTYRRFCRGLFDKAYAPDATQDVWCMLLDKLDSYRGDAEFIHFLNKIISNKILDLNKRAQRENAAFTNQYSDDSSAWEDDFQSPDIPPDRLVAQYESLMHLLHEAIPSLKSKPRLAYLLRHESEWWEGEFRLSWDYVAGVNRITVEDAAKRFERGYRALILNDNSMSRRQWEDDLVFLVWSQARRPALAKLSDTTWKYFGGLLNVSENNFKTWYRSVLEQLGKV